MRTRSWAVVPVLLVGGLTLGVSGCSSWSNTARGGAVGAGAGAAVGGLIGAAAGSTTTGVIIGAVVGGAAGAAIGREMDKQAEELQEELGDAARVERIGEGIAVTFRSGILFDVDSSTLRGEARANLADLAGSLQAYPGTDVLVVGHTDSTGADDYNLRLSQRRAQSAADYLMAQGLPPQRITTQGLGETEPIADNTTEVGRQRNRRVEIAIFASEEYRAEMEARYGT